MSDRELALEFIEELRGQAAFMADLAASASIDAQNGRPRRALERLQRCDPAMAAMYLGDAQRVLGRMAEGKEDAE